MNQVEIIARRILGWKLNRWDRWFDFEKGKFIPVADFQPEEKLDQAMLIVEKLKDFGFTYTTNGGTEVCFNNICETGDTLAQAITNARLLKNGCNKYILKACRLHPYGPNPTSFYRFYLLRNTVIKPSKIS